MGLGGTACPHCGAGMDPSSVANDGVCSACGGQMRLAKEGGTGAPGQFPSASDSPAEIAGPSSGERPDRRSRGEGKRTGLFTGAAFGVAAVAGVAYVLWAFVASHLPFSAFSVAGASQDDAPEYLARLSTSFFIYGMLSGFIAYHISLSPRRPQILQGLLWAVLGGGLLGAIIGAVTQLPAGLAGVEGARGLQAAIGAARVAAMAIGITTLFSSQDRRLLLKGLFVPFASGTTLSVLMLSIVPFNLGYLIHPWMLTSVVEESSGRAAGVTLVVAVVVIIVRMARRPREATA